MKTLMTVIGVAALLATGCATFGPNQVAAAQQAATTLTRELLIKNPDWKLAFASARKELAILEAKDVLSLSDLLDVVNRLPETESPSVRLTVDGINFVILLAGNPTASASTSLQLKQVAAGLGRGIDTAFGQLP